MPAAPEVTVIHDAELTAVHAQPAIDVTATDPVVAAAETAVALGEMENVHPAAWVTVNVCPAIVRVPERCAEAVFAATA